MTELQRSRPDATAHDVKLAAGGDEAAFSRLILEYEGMLYRVCRAVLRSEADCADAVQETVIAAWMRIGQLRNAESFPAWAARICLNRCYRIAAKRKREGGGDGPQGGTYQPPDARLDIAGAVSLLPRELKLVVVFYYFEDWSVARIAGTTGLFAGTVKSRLSRARKLLADTLKDYREGTRDDAR